jgi:hypothetical protein
MERKTCMEAILQLPFPALVQALHETASNEPLANSSTVQVAGAMWYENTHERLTVPMKVLCCFSRAEG